MKKLVLLLAAALVWAAPALHAQEKGIRVTRYTGQEITSVITNGGFEISLSQGPQTGATIEIDAKLEEHLEFDLKGGVLTIGLTQEFRNNKNWKEMFQRSKLRRATVVVSSLDKLSATTSACIKATGSFSGGRVSLNTSTSGRIEGLNLKAFETLKTSATTSGSIDCHVETTSVTGNATTSGRVTLTGTADTGSFTGSTSGDIDAQGLTLREVSAEMSTSGRASVNASERAKLRASTSGSVRYTGNPPSLDMRNSTGGRIKAL